MRRLVIGLVVLGALLVVADRVAKDVVENTLASHVESTEPVRDADVDIGGFPFLTQVVGNHFDDVTVTMPRFEASTVAGSIVLQDVEVSLRDVETSHRFTAATAESATGSAFVPYGAFDQFAPIEVSYAGDGPDGAGYVKVSAPSLGAGSVRVAPAAVRGLKLDFSALSSLSAALPRQLRAFVTGTHDFGGLPDGVTVERLEATPTGLDLTLAGADITIAR
jgi:hypothetical protein